MALFRGIIPILCAMVALAGPAGAEGGFTFKKIGAKTGKAAKAGNRINVQITPEEDWYKKLHREKMAREADQPEVGDDTAEIPQIVKPASDMQDWFWDANSPAITAARFGRLEGALDSLSRNPSHARKFSPDIGHYRALADKYGADILLATVGQEVSPALVLAVIGVESSGRETAESSAGAVGLMQLMDATATRFQVTDRTDPKQSIRGGAAYLAWLLKEFKGDPLLALAGYNAGENAVKKHKGVPPYAETRAYVPKVVAAWQVARSLCMTPPRYATDGCVFRQAAKQ